MECSSAIIITALGSVVGTDKYFVTMFHPKALSGRVENMTWSV